MKNHKVTSQTEYLIVSFLGEGSQSEVYKALRKDSEGQIEEEVALKVFKSEASTELWKNEYESLVRVNSRHCVSVKGFEWVMKRPTLCLEYVKGVSLMEALLHQRFTELEIKEIVIQCYRGLKDLNSINLCHGDLSPGNIMISEIGQCKLLDFGLANYQGSRKFGTPEYLHPGLRKGESPSFATDLFSLGKVLEFLLKRNPNSCSNPNPNSRSSSNLSSSSGHSLESLKNELLEARTSTIELLSNPDRESRAAGESLGEKIQSVLRTKDEGSQKTEEFVIKSESIQYQPSQRRPRERSKISLLAFGVVFVIAAVFGAAQTLPFFQSQVQEKKANSSLSIRTKSWRQIWLDGRDMGYTPLELKAIEPGQHQIKWVSNNASGEFSLTLPKGEHKLLTDKDFLQSEE